MTGCGGQHSLRHSLDLVSEAVLFGVGVNLNFVMVWKVIMKLL